MRKLRFGRALVLAMPFVAAGAFSRPVEAQTSGPFQYFAVTPCRAVDTRSGNGGVMPEGTLRNFTLKGVCGIPGTAHAVSLNATVVAPQADGHMVLWPTGSSVPLVSTLNFVAGEPAIANGAIIPIAASSPDLSATYGTCCGGNFNTNLILDITGYFQ